METQELEAQQAVEAGDDDEEDIDIHFSHPEGLVFAKQSGKCRSSFPDGATVPDAIKAAFGVVLLSRRHIGADDEQTGEVEQEFLCITGLGRRSLGIHEYSYEVTSLNSFQRNTIRPEKLAEMEYYSNYVETIEVFKSGFADGYEHGRWERGWCRSLSTSSRSVASQRDHPG